MQYYDSELYHYGIKGMKWGIRKNSRPNEDYSAKQRKQDRAFYGKGGERRINKKLNKGMNITTARHYEVERRDRNIKIKKNIKKGAKKVTKTIGTIGSLYVTDQVLYGGAGTEAAKRAVKSAGRAVVTAYTKARGGYDIHWYD